MGMFGSLLRGGAAAAGAPAAGENLPIADPSYTPSKLDTLWQVLFSGGSPADANEHLRELRYANVMRPAQMSAQQNFFKWLNGDGAPAGAPAPPAAPAAAPPSDPNAADPATAGAPTMMDQIYGQGIRNALKPLGPQTPPPQTTDEMFGQGIGNALAAMGAPSGQDPSAAAPAAPPPAIAPQIGAPGPSASAPRSIGGNPLNLMDPATQRALLGGMAFNVPGAEKAFDYAKAIQPDVTQGTDGWLYNKKTGARIARLPSHQVVNGFNLDLGADNAPDYIPTLPAGTAPDGQGGVSLLRGLPSALQTISQAQKTGETFGSIVEKPDENGKVQRGLGVNLYGPGGGSQGTSAGAQGSSPIGVAPSPQDAAYRNAVATDAAGRYKAFQDAGAAAPGAIARLQAMDNLLKGYEGGHFAPELYDLSSGLNSLGIKIDPRLANKDAAQVLQRTMASEAMKNPDTGANMFPRVTNFEYENALKQVPGLMQSAAGREIVVQMKTAEQNRIQDIAARARQWGQRFGRIDAPDASGKTFQDYLDAWSAKHPLYTGIAGLSKR